MHDTAKAGGVALPSVYTELGDIEPNHPLWAFLFGQVKWAVGVIHFSADDTFESQKVEGSGRADFQNMEAIGLAWGVEFGLHLFVCPLHIHEISESRIQLNMPAKELAHCVTFALPKGKRNREGIFWLTHGRCLPVSLTYAGAFPICLKEF